MKSCAAAVIILMRGWSVGHDPTNCFPSFGIRRYTTALAQQYRNDVWLAYNIPSGSSSIVRAVFTRALVVFTEGSQAGLLG